jgi:hypothetical protein
MDKIRRIAIVGNGATTRASNNFDGEIWTTAKVAFTLPRVDRIFEVHKEYDAGRLNGYTCPVLTDGVKDDIVNSEDLSVDWLVQKYGPVFQFSFDYMLALVYDLPDREREHIEVTLYGIDLTTDTEYNQFRQSFFYWIGMLRGSGITVNISQGSAIFNRRWVYCHERDEIQEASIKLSGLADKKVEEYISMADEAQMKLAYSNGYKQCAIDIGRMGA